MTYRYLNSRWKSNSRKIQIITQYPRTIAYYYFFMYSASLRFLKTRGAFSINTTFLGYKIYTNLVCDTSLSTLRSYLKAIKIRLTYFFIAISCCISYETNCFEFQSEFFFQGFFFFSSPCDFYKIFSFKFRKQKFCPQFL